jgi:hypothetical protein
MRRRPSPHSRPARRTPKAADYDATVAKLRGLFARLQALEAQSIALGGAPKSRDLLRCPRCGLQEDVLAGGAFVVARPDQPRTDTGLRFEKLTNGRYHCPVCYAQVEEPPWEPPADLR